LAKAESVGRLVVLTMNLTMAAIDLTPVTGELTSLGTAVVTAAAVAAAAALGVGAIFYGGKALWRFFKGLAK
jgi:hypothetical protein